MSLFTKNDTMIDGVLFMKKDDVQQIVDDMLYICEKLGYDIYDASMLAAQIRTSHCFSTVQVPIRTTEKIWKELKSGTIKSMVASTEKEVAC